MSWKPGLSRYLPSLRFFACPDSPSSRGVLQFYARNYDELKLLNPHFPMMIRTTENAMPAVTTELEWTVQHVLRFMVQSGRFRDSDSIAEDRVEAAKAHLATDWDKMALLRWSMPGFDPERPGLDEDRPDWREDPEVQDKLGPYLAMKDALKEQEATFKGGPNDEYTRGENALLMCQRVDLWCAGPLEVERAVQHLYKLGRACNEREVEYPSFITEFVPGAHDMQDD